MIGLIFGWMLVVGLAFVGLYGFFLLYFRYDVFFDQAGEHERVLKVEIPRGPRGLDGEDFSVGRIRSCVRRLLRRR